MQRKSLFFKNRWVMGLMMATMFLGGQHGVVPAVGSRRVGLLGVEAAAAESPASGSRTPAKAPADQPVPGETESPRTFAGKRDPFRIPAAPRGPKAEDFMGPLPPGKRGLVIRQLKLEGIVRDDANKSMLAVVTNQTNRAYFLRVHDEVYNGVVGEITLDSIHFRENRLDNNGRLETQEVVLKLGAHPREGR
jgi:hypothetical protein